VAERFDQIERGCAPRRSYPKENTNSRGEHKCQRQTQNPPSLRQVTATIERWNRMLRLEPTIAPGANGMKT
jgi:hypothetical protein